MATPVAVVFLAEGFEDIEAVTVIDVLRRGGVDVTTVSVGGSLSVKSAHGIEMRADRLLDDIGDGVWDAVILPGGMPGTTNLAGSSGVIEALKRHRDEGRVVCAICAAPTILTSAGILPSDVHVTCYPSCAVDLDRPSANVPVVVDGNFITGQAPGSAMLFSLVVLQTLMGEDVASKIARGMVTNVLDP